MVENKKMSLEKTIQAYEMELRKHNVFGTQGLYLTFFELNQKFEEFKLFIDSVYTNDYSFELLFSKEHQRNDEYYVRDIFQYNFKTPVNLRNKILKFMKLKGIKALPYETYELIVYPNGKVYLNGELMRPMFVIFYLRDLKIQRIPIKVSFMPQTDMDLFKTANVDFKKYYFTKKNPEKWKKEELKEYKQLIDKSIKEEMTKKEINRMKEREITDKRIFRGKTEYLYKLENNNPIIIEKFWNFSEIEKLLNGIGSSLFTKIRYIISTNEEKKGWKWKERLYNMCDFFDNLKTYSEMNIGERIKKLRNNIDNNDSVDIEEIDYIVTNVSKFMVDLEDKLYFLELDKFFESKRYKFKLK